MTPVPVVTRGSGTGLSGGSVPVPGALVLCLLVWFGVVTPMFLARAWRHAIFFIALGSAIITPGDGPSMLVLALPLILLYFLSVGVAWLLWRARGRKAEAR